MMTGEAASEVSVPKGGGALPTDPVPLCFPPPSASVRLLIGQKSEDVRKQPSIRQRRAMIASLVDTYLRPWDALGSLFDQVGRVEGIGLAPDQQRGCCNLAEPVPEIKGVFRPEHGYQARRVLGP